MMPIDRRGLLLLASAAATAGRGRAAMASASPGLTVTTTHGRVRGRAAGDIRVFSAIPYGSAARFAAPVPAARWRDVRDATGPAALAPQTRGVNAFAGQIDEDCLQLNVWAPAAPGPHPVLVYVHGGANETGWSGDEGTAGDRFAAHGIVCVTVNYRLGALGFVEIGGLLGPAYAGSANNAMRDLVLALQWVRANIAAFGGDPTRVTLAGESAGGKNVGTLLGMPAADGLYARAAIFSGGAQTVHRPDEARSFAAVFADRLGGAEKLLSASTEAIVAAQDAAKAQWPRNFPFRPMVDGRLLPAVPLARIRAGAGRPTPLLIGSNADESRLFLPPALASEPLREKNIANESMARVRALEDAYAHAFPNLSPAERHWRLLTAEEYGMPCLRIAEAHAARGADVFRYRLTYPAPGGPFAGLSPHVLDVPFSFDHVTQPGFGGFFGLSARDQPLADILHRCVASFVAEGRPSAGGLPMWGRYETTGRSTLVLGRTVGQVSDPDRLERITWGSDHATPRRVSFFGARSSRMAALAATALWWA